jgi:hypothetical protein
MTLITGLYMGRTSSMTKLMKLNIQMFASGTIDGSSTASLCDCRIVWSSTLNAETNTSSVSASIQVYKSGTGSTTGTFSGTLYIDGVGYGVSKYTTWAWGTWNTVGSATKTVTHNENGTKAITISGNLTQSGTSMAGTYSASNTATLDTNNRASILGDIANFGIADTINIATTKYVEAYSDTLVIKAGTTTIKTITSITNGYSLTFSSGEQTSIKALMTSPQIQLEFILSTYNGATQIGSSSTKYAYVTSLDKPVLYNIKKKTNGYYQLAINGIVNDDDAGTLQIYNDDGIKTFSSERSSITAYQNANTSATVAQYNKIEANLNTVQLQRGTKLELNGKYIKNVSSVDILVEISGVMNTQLATQTKCTTSIIIVNSSGSTVSTLTNVFNTHVANPYATSITPIRYVLPAGYQVKLALQNQETSRTLLIYGRSGELTTYLTVAEV